MRMRWFWLGFCFIAIVGFAMGAEAGTVTVSWNNPVTNTDGSAIPTSGAGSIASTRVQWGTCSGTAFGTAISQIIVNAPLTSAEIGSLAPGTYCFRAYARNTYAQESGPSNVAQKSVTEPVPDPPTIVTITTAAMELRSGKYGPWLARQVGTVPLGTACIGSALLRDYYEVPLSSVVLKLTPKSGSVVVARCSA